MYVASGAPVLSSPPASGAPASGSTTAPPAHARVRDACFVTCGPKACPINQETGVADLPMISACGPRAKITPTVQRFLGLESVRIPLPTHILIEKLMASSPTSDHDHHARRDQEEHHHPNLPISVAAGLGITQPSSPRRRGRVDSTSKLDLEWCSSSSSPGT